MGEPLRDTGGRDVVVSIDLSAVRNSRGVAISQWTFPDPRRADDHGLIGNGGDFTPSTILTAYSRGIFPWPHPEAEMLWFSPNPRAIIPLDGLKISRRLGRTIRSGRFRVTVDAAFSQVIAACAETRPEGTWVTPALRAGYSELHELGWAHSFEVWDRAGSLAGGLYGVAIGAMFGAESMFHRATDASKVAMVALVQHARTIGLELIDVQVLTDHTERIGAIEIGRDEYLARLAVAVRRGCPWA